MPEWRSLESLLDEHSAYEVTQIQLMYPTEGPGVFECGIGFCGATTATEQGIKTHRTVVHGKRK